jgi:hypothetical protein
MRHGNIAINMVMQYKAIVSILDDGELCWNFWLFKLGDAFRYEKNTTTYHRFFQVFMDPPCFVKYLYSDIIYAMLYEDLPLP